MKSYPITVKPFGQQAILVEWPNKVEESILSDILGFIDCFKALNLPNWEMSAAYNSLTMVNYDGKIDFEKTKELILDCHEKRKRKKSKNEKYLWRIPVCYDADFGLDLNEVSNTLNLTTDALIASHTSHEYTVYGIGFLPGFMYLGGLPKTLETERRKEPRLSVAKGSVGLAGKQTGIYPQDSPGGWNIIGSCPIPIFDVKMEKPCFVNVGDRIQFYQISRAEYDLRKIESEVGIFKLEKTLFDV